MAKKKCGIQAAGGMIGYAACELDWGHDGDVHDNAGDGFYSRQNDAEHHRRQRSKRGKRSGPSGGTSDDA